MVPGAESGVWGENGGAATSEEDRGAAAACSNVASGVMLTEILEAARDAITALEQGDIAIAKTRLRALLDLIRGLDHAVPRLVFTARPPPSA